MDRSLCLALAFVAVGATAACNSKSDCASLSPQALPPSAESGGNSNDAAKGSSPSHASSSSSSSSGSSGSNAGSSAGGAEATRAIAEADIVQLDQEQNRIYAMSKNGSLAIVDAATPGKLTLMGKATLKGEPFEMYRRGDILLTMTNDASTAAIVPFNVANPAAPTAQAALTVPGEVADSRIVGHILYLATYENGSCYSCAQGNPRTLVTTFDIASPLSPKQIDQVEFTGKQAPAGLDYAWSTPWKRSIIATTNRLYVGGLASNPDTTADEGVIEVLDISDPNGKLVRGAKVTMAGPVMSRWQMDESNGFLRVVSQRGAGRTGNGEKFPDIDTFRIESSTSLVRLGHTTLTLPRQEGLKTVRFDGTRAYAITFNQTDPLFTIDLTDPASPKQRGELQIPGWMFHLEPRGDKLIGLGLDRTDQSGNLNVSLFDVADLDHPSLVKRASFGPTDIYEDYMITNGVLAEDQDRIQKSFRIDQDGLISVPFSGGTGSCTSEKSGIQLLEWQGSTLTKRGLLPLAGNPRRAVRRDSDAMKELIAISDSNVRAFSIDNRESPKQVADLVIGTCEERTVDGQSVGGNRGQGWEGDGYYPNDYNPGDDRSHSTSSSYRPGSSLCN